MKKKMIIIMLCLSNFIFSQNDSVHFNLKIIYFDSNENLSLDSSVFVISGIKSLKKDIEKITTSFNPDSIKVFDNTGFINCLFKQYYLDDKKLSNSLYYKGVSFYDRISKKEKPYIQDIYKLKSKRKINFEFINTNYRYDDFRQNFLVLDMLIPNRPVPDSIKPYITAIKNLNTTYFPYDTTYFVYINYLNEGLNYYNSYFNNYLQDYYKDFTSITKNLVILKNNYNINHNVYSVNTENLGLIKLNESNAKTCRVVILNDDLSQEELINSIKSNQIEKIKYVCVMNR